MTFRRQMLRSASLPVLAHLAPAPTVYVCPAGEVKATVQARKPDTLLYSRDIAGTVETRTK